MAEGLLLPEPCGRIAAWASPGHRFGGGVFSPRLGGAERLLSFSPPPLLTPASGGKTLLMCLTNDVCISQPFTCECVHYERWGVTCRSEGLVVCNSHVFSHTESGCQKTARAFVAWRCFMYVPIVHRHLPRQPRAHVWSSFGDVWRPVGAYHPHAHFSVSPARPWRAPWPGAALLFTPPESVRVFAEIATWYISDGGPVLSFTKEMFLKALFFITFIEYNKVISLSIINVFKFFSKGI